jgi:hypothetical protein
MKDNRQLELLSLLIMSCNWLEATGVGAPRLHPLAGVLLPVTSFGQISGKSGYPPCLR